MTLPAPVPRSNLAELTDDDRATLFEQHRMLARWCAGKYAKMPGFTHDDIEQACLVGLWNASRLFDVTRGVKFTTYAVRSMRRTVVRQIREERLGIRIPSRLHDQLGRLTVAPASQTDHLDLSEREQQALRALRAKSIDANWNDQEQRPGELADESSNPADLALDADMVETLLHHIDALPERTAKAVRLYFGIGCQPKTLAAVGSEIGITRERVRQLVQDAIRQLRHRMTRRGQ